MGFEIINKIKKEKGLTNAQIASMAGITLSTLDKITAGINTNPKLDTLQSICKVLGCTLNDFDDNFNSRNIYTVDEQSLINKYRTLDGYGKEAVDSILNIEHKRCAGQSEAPRPMIRAAARSGDITQIEEILPEELPDNTPLP